jgi:hypothetical protein
MVQTSAMIEGRRFIPIESYCVRNCFDFGMLLAQLTSYFLVVGPLVEMLSVLSLDAMRIISFSRSSHS